MLTEECHSGRNEVSGHLPKVTHTSSFDPIYVPLSETFSPLPLVLIEKKNIFIKVIIQHDYMNFTLKV